MSCDGPAEGEADFAARAAGDRGAARAEAVPVRARDADGEGGAGESDRVGSGRLVAGTSEGGADGGGCAAIGTARGGSYAVPVITECTPHHDSVAAAPVASDHAKA